MRITKRQLKRIVKEERARLLTEDSIQGAEERLDTAIRDYVEVMGEELGYGIPTEQLKAEVLNAVDGFFDTWESESYPEVPVEDY